MKSFKLTVTDYPDLEGDEARRSVWTVDVPLAATHHLRNIINTGKPIPNEILQRYEIPIVASALRLYFLELPGESAQSSSIDADLTKDRFSGILPGLRNHEDHIHFPRIVL